VAKELQDQATQAFALSLKLQKIHFDLSPSQETEAFQFLKGSVEFFVEHLKRKKGCYSQNIIIHRFLNQPSKQKRTSFDEESDFVDVFRNALERLLRTTYSPIYRLWDLRGEVIVVSFG